MKMLLPVAIWACLLVSGCGDGSAPRASQTRPHPTLPSFRIAALTDLEGYLEPCGCQSRPLGGIDRAAQRLRELNADGVPLLVLAAGDLFFGSEPGSHGPSGAEAAHAGSPSVGTQEQWQAETLARALAKLNLAAATPGRSDRARGAAALGELAKLSGARLLCAAPVPGADAPAACQAGLLLDRGGVQIGVWGLEGESAPDKGTGLIESAQRATDDLRARGATIVLGLIDSDARTARRVAGATKGLDFLLHGGAHSAEVPPPERIGDATLLRAGRQGQGVLVIDVFKAPTQGPLTDVSAWTQRAARTALERRAAELANRIEEWRRDSSIDRAQLAEQERRLSTLRQAMSHEPVTRVTGSTFSAQYLELDAKTAQDPDLRALLVAHDRRVNEHNRIAWAAIKPKPVPAGTAGYVGSERCGDCHESAVQWWKQHAHGRAYATLERVEKQFSLSCVSCHVTGYGQPGGATVVHNAGLTNVGCESCHGPGSLHVANPDVEAAKNVHRAAPESTCRPCHDAEHSDRFDYATYRARLIVPGHGKPAAEPR